MAITDCKETRRVTEKKSTNKSQFRWPLDVSQQHELVDVASLESSTTIAMRCDEMRWECKEENKDKKLCNFESSLKLS